MADVPDAIVLKRDRDLEGRQYDVWVRRVLDGDPIVLVQDGRMIEKNLRRERLTVEDIAEQARSSQIASLEDIQWAVFEPNGAISLIPKQ